ncbi:MAG TPA: ATP-dependent RNA helicase HrpA [Gammaproteobacteria bacterium]|nr:ATP-dependent RNA helicase HrpA [Gammaproteobacteria bacterium]
MSGADAALAARLGAVALADRRELERLHGAIRARRRRRQPTSELEQRFEAALRAAEQRAAARRATRYTLRYPESLPISAMRAELVARLREHRVVVVCGDTGSGKTTQLPKLLLEAGCGVVGMIGHTQPRRIAAQAAATRLAAELEVPLGEAVGLTVRFTDETGPGTLVKVMTDGILLNEIRTDRRLEAYDALIIDEAHERSLNIDFILGYLRSLERQRPDLKIVITSATIDPERFSRHFGDAPIVRVEGRSYPVGVRYRPRDEDQDLAAAVTAAARELAAERVEGPVRDMLVFLPGERWIRDAEHALGRYGPNGYEVLPLYARLTSARQRRILEPGKAPRIVLATNIAETSLTVPRIRYVIDSGLARVSRYGTRHRVQSLGVEPIAQANAVQRAGRCGRLAPGVCVRLYSEEDFAARPAYTEPEILRTGLAGVLLRLEALRLGPVDEFPFIDPPPAKAVSDAYQLLHLLGALDTDRKLTPDGDVMARLPVDPRVARLLVVANRNQALREGLVIAAALSVVDPREYAVDADAARRKHEAFNDPRSEFTTWLNLWNAYRRERRGGERALRAWCREQYLSAARLREWHDVHGQLHELVQGLGWRTRHEGADYRAIHQAVLAAFIDFIAEHEDGVMYRGMRGSRAQLIPNTPLAKKRPHWLVAAERVATERQYLRTVAQVNPRWALRVAPHLVRYEYHDPLWDAERGQVTAREVVTLFGLTLASEKRVDYGRFEPVEARRLFIDDALAADQAGFDSREPAFLAANRALRRSVLEWEARLRKRDLYVGDTGVAAFYDERLPPQVHDRASLAAWCAAGHDPELHMTIGDVSSRDIARLPAASYPGELVLAGQRLALTYAFEPGADHDGLTVSVPRPLLGAIRPEQLDWLVPGWLPEKILAILRGLPKELRKPLVPLPDTVSAVLAWLGDRVGRQPLTIAVAEALREVRGVEIASAVLDARALAPHLTMRVAVLDTDGSVRAVSRDLRALQRQASAGPGAEAVVRGSPAARWQRSGITQWDFGDLPESVQVAQQPRDLVLYPALQDVDGRVDLKLVPPGPAAVAQHRAGVRRLLLKALPQQVALVRDRTLAERDLVLGFHGIGGTAALIDDLLCAAAEQAFALDPAVRDPAAFAAVREKGRSELVPAADELRALLKEILPLHRALRRELDGTGGAGAAVRADIAGQLDELIRPGFLTATPPQWRRHLPRYLKAAHEHWEKRGQRRERALAAEVHAAAARLEHWRASLPDGWPWPDAIVEYRWLLEELRVSLFAQALGTARPVSAKRLEQLWSRALAGDAGASAARG